MNVNLRLASPQDPASHGARSNLLEGIERMFNALPRGQGWADFPFNTLILSSWYQPIFCVERRALCGYEGLLHATNLSGRQIAADTVFALSANQEEELFLDWLCRALHLRNIANLGMNRGERGLVFLNAFPHAAVEDTHHPDVFARMLSQFGVSPSDVVVEILETGVADESHLIDAAALYRRLGCKIAIDDFGIGYSNFDRLWRIRPDFVKIDRSVIKSAATETHARLVLANMVRLVKSCGAKVVIEGIENRNEAQIAIEVGADMLQGYFFGRPSQQCFAPELAQQMLAAVQEGVAESARNQRVEFGRHEEVIRAAAASIGAGQPFDLAAVSLLGLPNAVRAYVLEPQTHSAADQSAIVIHISEDQAWLNLPTPDSAVWRVRNIVERSLAHPAQIQFTAPLVIDAIPPAPTLTLSCAVGGAAQPRVLCVDLIATDTIVDTREAGDPPILGVSA